MTALRIVSDAPETTARRTQHSGPSTPEGLRQRRRNSTLRVLHDELFADELARRNRSLATVRAYAGMLNKWEALTDDPPLCAIDQAAVDAFADALKFESDARGGSNETVNKHLKHLGGLLSHLGPKRDRHRRAASLLTMDELPETPQFEGVDIYPASIDPGDLGRLYENAHAWGLSTDGRVPPALVGRVTLALLLNTSARVEDALGLTWGAITGPLFPVAKYKAEHPFGWIDFTASKTGRRHIVPIAKPTADLLAQLAERIGHNLIDHRPPSDARVLPIGGQANADRVMRRQLLKTWCEQVGVTPVRFKDFRPTGNQMWNWACEKGQAGEWVCHPPSGINGKYYSVGIPFLLAAVDRLAWPEPFTA